MGLFAFNKPLILATSSPQRLAMFESFGFSFQHYAPDVPEQALAEETWQDYGKRIVEAKAEAVITQFSLEQQDAFLIAADTFGLAAGKIIGKPADEEEAKANFRQFVAEPHQVISFVHCRALATNEKETWCEATTLEFYPYPPEIYHHPFLLEGSQAFSGGYTIEKNAAFLVKKLAGSYLNVLGFPMEAFLYKAWQKKWLACI